MVNGITSFAAEVYAFPCITLPISPQFTDDIITTTSASNFDILPTNISTPSHFKFYNLICPFLFHFRFVITYQTHLLHLIFCCIFINYSLHFINMILVQNSMLSSYCINLILSSNYDFGENFKLLLL